MRRFRFSVPATAAIGVGLFLLLTGVFVAGPTVVDPTSGCIMAVDVATDPLDPYVQGVRLRSQTTSGQVSYEFVPSTYDPVVDAEPTIAVHPYGGIVVVWSRDDGADFELAMASRSINGVWSPEIMLTSNSKPDTQARVLVDNYDQAHVLWWGDGVGGPVYLRSFGAGTGQPIGTAQRPFEPQNPRDGRRSLDSGTYDQIGGMDDPAAPTSKASAVACSANPAAAPDHGVVMACGRPAAYQVTDCRLVLGLQDPSTGAWSQSLTDLSTVSLSGISPRDIAQSLADHSCN